jgi:hypothetical protein
MGTENERRPTAPSPSLSPAHAHPSSPASSVSPVRRRWILVTVTAIVLFLILQFFSSSSSSSSSLSLSSSSSVAPSDHHQEKKNQCKYNENNDPAAAAELFYLQTISGVHYDGGHWFHVAENFMVQHSILRASQGEGKTPEVYFLTDRGEN